MDPLDGDLAVPRIACIGEAAISVLLHIVVPCVCDEFNQSIGRAGMSWVDINDNL
jgi:hypothetical protein